MFPDFAITNHYNKHVCLQIYPYGKFLLLLLLSGWICAFNSIDKIILPNEPLKRLHEFIIVPTAYEHAYFHQYLTLSNFKVAQLNGTEKKFCFGHGLSASL